MAFFGNMNDDTDILNTIEVLGKRIRTKEEEVNELKALVNKLCSEAGVAVRYANIAKAGAAVGDIQADAYYGQNLTAAIRDYLERRKASGLSAASVSEIYQAIRDGGYKFDTKSELNAKIGVGNALRKTSAIFHRLPNGEYGLLAWYPGIKERPAGESHPARKKKRHHPAKAAAPPKPAEPAKPASEPTTGEKVTNGEIREVILSQSGNFKSRDIEAAVKAKFPGKVLPKTKVPQVVSLLREKGDLKEVSARSGKRPAVFTKA
jgi:hypothetical protein